MNSKKQGNGLIVVMIILAAIAFGVYSVFDLVNTEFRLNKRAELYNEAKQAAESIATAMEAAQEAISYGQYATAVRLLRCVGKRGFMSSTAF